MWRNYRWVRLVLPLFACLAAVPFAAAAKPLAKPAVKPMRGAANNEPLGSLKYYPTPERPVGWRGDGTGRYPGATPPTVWERKAVGNSYATKGIVWMQPLPNIGVSTPIVVGDRIFLTGEVSDLICLDKKTGRILWIRSNREFESLTPEELKEDPEYGTTLAPLAQQLSKLNSDVAEVLNAALSNPKAAKLAEPALKAKKDLDKKIQDAQTAIDKKLFNRYWAQAVFGFAGQTPTSDGKNVYAFFTTGVSVCYDLNGNRKWIARGSGGGSEHGNFASPLLCDNRLIVWANELRAYEADSGKLAWTVPAKAGNTYGSLFHLKSGGEDVAGFQWGNFVRVRDGQAVWQPGAFGDCVATPIVDGDYIYAHEGYPKNNKGAFKAFKIPASTSDKKIEPAFTFNLEWGENEMVVDKQTNPFARGFVASPLLVDGLIYQVTQGGGLLVNDAATGEQVYRKVLPLHPRTEYWNWSGAAASPTAAGKFVYLLDNQGNTLVIKPGRKYEVVAENSIAELTNDQKQKQNLATPIFEGARMYYRTADFLYCIGDK
ncbi:MAG TPA: PQQ-binding-like beta-propeller repeat protein [Pirellulales bacterium]|jgi:hypothetical protein|nr:PQQ-binding-like beta-propeller repeat protein [Pirellulales bacterium]